MLSVRELSDKKAQRQGRSALSKPPTAVHGQGLQLRLLLVRRQQHEQHGQHPAHELGPKAAAVLLSAQTRRVDEVLHSTTVSV